MGKWGAEQKKTMIAKLSISFFISVCGLVTDCNEMFIFIFIA